MIDFTGFPKIARWNRDIIITEKIDGTNAQIFIAKDCEPIEYKPGKVVPFLCGSRNRWVFPESDNHGFAKWAYEHVYELLTLGPGSHFGEWWGQGIQRGYGLKEKRFSLFNVTRWKDGRPSCCSIVPVLYQGPMFSEEPTVNRYFKYEEDTDYFQINHISEALYKLRVDGSIAAPGFMKPEGVVIFHTASNHCYKVTLENDDKPKGVVV